MLILLAKADALRLLEQLFDAVVLAPAVREEAIAQAPTPAEQNALSIEVERRRFVTKSPSAEERNRLSRSHAVLGAGELETLALVSSRKAGVAILDDRIARQIAQVEAIPVVGTLGILARAHRKGVASKQDLRRIIERLTAAGLWLSPDILEGFWGAVGGR